MAMGQNGNAKVDWQLWLDDFGIFYFACTFVTYLLRARAKFDHQFKKLVSLLAISLERLVNTRIQIQILLPP